MPRRHAMQRAELLDLLQRQLVPAQVQPAVKEQAAMAGREDKPVAIYPARLLGIMHQRMAVEHGADLRAAQRQAEVAGRAGVDCVDGEATGLIRSLGQDRRREGHRELPDGYDAGAASSTRRSLSLIATAALPVRWRK